MAMASAMLLHPVPLSVGFRRKIPLMNRWSLRLACSSGCTRDCVRTLRYSRLVGQGSVTTIQPLARAMGGELPSRHDAKALPGREGDGLPTMPEILAVAEERGVVMKLKSIGPLFSVTALDPEGKNLGKAEGFIKLWIQGPVLHLDTMRLTKASASRSGRSVFGVGLLVGALSVRHGLDCGCQKGELLAINDTDIYHEKLVRYYSRLGWKPVYEVTGDSWRDMPHMLVWGGIGTRMDADLHELLSKWSSTLRPKEIAEQNPRLTD